MNLKKLVITLLVLYLGYHMIIHKNPQSIFYSDNTTQDVLFSGAPKISENPIVQNAYQICKSRFEADFRSENSHLPRDVYRMLKNEMPDICKDEILASCKKGLNNYFCESVLNRYK